MQSNLFLNASPGIQMRSSGYSLNGSIANDSNGFYPSSLSTSAYYPSDTRSTLSYQSYDKNNPNAKITSKTEEMIKRTEALSRKQKFDYSNDEDIMKIK